MFQFDTWQEILDTLRRNRLRTVLTGFSVAWGVLMLVVLLGSGQGLERGIRYQFRDDAINSIWVSPGQTSVPHRGLQPGRQLQFTNTDYDEIKHDISGVEHITARFVIRSGVTVSYGGKSQNFPVRSVHPDHLFLENTKVVRGRFLNLIDLREFRKVAVIGRNVANTFFGKKEPLGAEVLVNNIAFRIVGVFEDDGNEREMEYVYLPITTAQRTFNGADRIAQVMLTTGDLPLPVTESMSEDIRQQLSDRHRFAPDDERAVFINNLNERFERFRQLMQGIRGFIWMIGIGTLLAGVVGVSNVMMIAVRERTRELGVRKALGATPGSIVRMVLQEAVLLTALSGYLGLVAGVALLEGMALLPQSDFFRQPGVELGTALAATALLVVAGSLAGWVPARRAASIRPIEALRDE